MNRKEIEEAAAAWFAKRESGDWSPNEQSKLEAWLESSTAHRIAYIRIVSTWERSGRLCALGAGLPPGTIPARDTWNFSTPPSAPTPLPSGAHLGSASQLESSSASFRPSATWLRAASGGRARLRIAAALLILGSTVGLVWYLTGYGTNSYRTSIGALATIPLSDGSRVMLNTDSQIDVVLKKTGRYVKLDRGEASFNVAKDVARPFTVEIADKRVVAVGTQFSVRRDGNDIRVYVEEGSVELKHLGVGSEATETRLPAGSEARTANKSFLVDQPTPTQVEQLLSWRTGYIKFRDTALADAVVEFNRYSPHRIVIGDTAIANIHIGGNFRTDDVDGFLGLLQSGFPVKVERRGELIILTQR